MQIGELAKQAGVNVQTIRFYERKKLLPAPKRKPSGYRVYSEEDLHRLRFIRQAKSLGFSLDEIREILDMRARGGCPCDRVLSLGKQHLREIQQKIRQLKRFAKELDLALKQWKKSKQPGLAANEFCALIERTMPDQHRTRSQRGRTGQPFSQQ
jgi:MerR family copper efflux transcriptional regulator